MENVTLSGLAESLTLFCDYALGLVPWFVGVAAFVGIVAMASFSLIRARA